MKITRRRFAQYIGAALALLHLPKPVIASGLPRLVGDGIHNDAPAMQALLARQPIEIGPLVDVTGAGWTGDQITLPMGNFYLQDTLRIEGLDSIILSGQVQGTRYRTVFLGRGFAFHNCGSLGIENIARHLGPPEDLDPEGWDSANGFVLEWRK